jgi:hypothetical protein
VQLGSRISSLRKVQNPTKPNLVISRTTHIVSYDLDEKFGLQTHEGMSHV